MRVGEGDLFFNVLGSRAVLSGGCFMCSSVQQHGGYCGSLSLDRQAVCRAATFFGGGCVTYLTSCCMTLSVLW